MDIVYKFQANQRPSLVLIVNRLNSSQYAEYLNPSETFKKKEKEDFE